MALDTANKRAAMIHATTNGFLPFADGTLDAQDRAHMLRIFACSFAAIVEDYYRVYRGQDGQIDYGEVVATMALDDVQVSIPNQDLPPNTIWHYVRRRVAHCCSKESNSSPVCIIMIDANGDMIGLTPNTPQDLRIVGLSNARFLLKWRYTEKSQEIAPSGFKIYMDSGLGFDFGDPEDTVPYMLGRGGEFSWLSDPLVDGQVYRFCVRSYRQGEGESQNTNCVSGRADAEGPPAIEHVYATWEEV